MGRRAPAGDGQGAPFSAHSRTCPSAASMESLGKLLGWIATELGKRLEWIATSRRRIEMPLLVSRVGMRHSSSSTFRQYAAEYAAAVHSKAKEADGEEEGTGIEKREKTFRDFFCGLNPMGEALSTDESLR